MQRTQSSVGTCHYIPRHFDPRVRRITKAILPKRLPMDLALWSPFWLHFWSPFHLEPKTVPITGREDPKRSPRVPNHPQGASPAISDPTEDVGRQLHLYWLHFRNLTPKMEPKSMVFNENTLVLENGSKNYFKTCSKVALDSKVWFAIENKTYNVTDFEYESCFWSPFCQFWLQNWSQIVYFVTNIFSFFLSHSVLRWSLEPRLLPAL